MWHLVEDNVPRTVPLISLPITSGFLFLSSSLFPLSTANQVKQAQILTSKGKAVAFVMPWVSLLVTLLLLLMRGPAPRTCWRTLNALASELPKAAPSATTAAWTRLWLFCSRISPGGGVGKGKKKHYNKGLLPIGQDLVPSILCGTDFGWRYKYLFHKMTK